MSDDGGELVPLFPAVGDDDRMLTTTGHDRRPWCGHQRVTLDTETRRVHCRECGREVDAFDALHTIARDGERWLEQRDELRRQARRAADDLEELKRDERNAKARKRRRDAR